MTIVTIDTHAFVKRLKAAGADEELAEVIASGVSEAGGALATKADLKAELAQLETRMTNRFYLVAGLIVAAVGLLVRFMP